MEMTNYKELIKSEEFEKALVKGVEVKKSIDTDYKTKDKDNYTRFYEVVLNGNQEIKELMEKRKKNRTPEENDKVMQFKKDVSKSYRMLCNLLAPEELEENKPTKCEKIVDRLAPILAYLRYCEKTELDEAFSKRGITLSVTPLEERSEFWKDNANKVNFKEIVQTGTDLRKLSEDNKLYIKEDIFQSSVPTDLQYDKSMNPTGIKQMDFFKLVDIKTKMAMAADEEAKDKVEEQVQKLAAEKQFDNARNELIQEKLINL